MGDFIKSLESRIEIAKAILSDLSDLKALPNQLGYANFGGSARKIYYDEEKVNHIKDSLAKWQHVTKQILINRLGEDNENTSLFANSIVRVKMGFDYKTELTREISRGINALESIIESVGISGFQISEKNDTNEVVKKPLVFISHSSKDIAFVESLVDLLENIGLDDSNLFCSSIPGYWIDLSENIFEVLLSLFTNRSLYVIFVQSPNFYKSPVSLNEMGAAWALKSEYCSILTPEMDFSEMTAVVNSHTTAIKVNSPDAKARLTEMKDSILRFINKPNINASLWERKRDKFLKEVEQHCTTTEQSKITSENEEFQQLMIEKLKQEKEERLKAKIRGNIFTDRNAGYRNLRIFNDGISNANNIRIEWLNPHSSVTFLNELENIEALTPQNKREFRIMLCIGAPDTIHLRYIWDDEFQADNVLEEILQL